MDTIIFSVTLSVSLVTAALMLLKKSVVKLYGFKLIYIFSLILSIRLLIPYCFPIPNAAKLHLELPGCLLPVWLLGAVIFFGFHFSGYIHFVKKIKKRGELIEQGEIYEIFLKVKKDRFIFTPLRLIKSDDIACPMLIGFIKPAVVIPSLSYTKEEYEMVFCHELLHFQKKDNIKKLFFLTVTALEWFNPFAYLLMGEAFQSLECLCDENVLKNTSSGYKRSYCFTLLKTNTRNTGLSMVSYLNDKDRVKMRIENIWDEGKKRKGTVPALCLFFTTLLLSSLLCGCMVDTPQDVMDDMNRISTGTENENTKSTGETAPAADLEPVKLVTENARAQIKELGEKDGIFKFDKCRVIIPQLEEINIYRLDFYYEADTPRKIYDMFRSLEKEWLGKKIIPDESLCAVPYQMEWEGLTIEEYLKDDRIASIYTLSKSENNCSIEVMPSSLRLWSSPFYNEVDTEEGLLSGIDKPSRTIECLYADEETLSEKFTLSDGEITLGEAVESAQNYMNTFKYTVDEKINYRVQTVTVKELLDGTCALTFYLRNFCGDMPFVSIYYGQDDPPFSAKRIGGVPTMEMTMLRHGRFDSIITYYSNTKLTAAKESLKEIVPLNLVFDLIKDELSNAVVYDVMEISLGYTDFTAQDETSGESGKTPSFVEEKHYTYPVYDIVLRNGMQEIKVTVDASTGELYIDKYY